MERTVALLMLMISVSLVVSLGCRSSNFRARNLPTEFRAAASQKGNDLNFARLSSAGSSYSLLAAGDLLEVTVATGREDEKTNPMSVRVANDGSVTIPLVGPVPVAGMEAFDAAQSITSHAVQRGIYLHPVVTVDIKTKAMNRITVLGAVENPGVHEIPRGSCDVVAALAAAGGLTEEAGVDLEIIRQASSPVFTAESDSSTKSGELQLAAYQSLQQTQQPLGSSSGPQLTRINLADARQAGRIETGLNDRDVVMIPERKKEIFHVAGLVKEPGQFEVPDDQDVHLLDAISLAGGLRSPVADKVYVIRRLEGRQPVVIQASVLEAKHNGAENIRLAAGDTITVERTPITVVVDTFSNLIRFSVGLAGRTTVF